MSSGFDRKKFSHNKVNSLYFMAPERILAKVDMTKETQLAKCDIWSVGVILFFLLFGEFPFNGSNTSKLVKHIKSAKIKVQGSKKWAQEVESLFDLIS